MTMAVMMWSQKNNIQRTGFPGGTESLVPDMVILRRVGPRAGQRGTFK